MVVAREATPGAVVGQVGDSSRCQPLAAQRGISQRRPSEPKARAHLRSRLAFIARLLGFSPLHGPREHGAMPRIVQEEIRVLVTRWIDVGCGPLG